MAAILGREFDWSHLPRLAGVGETEVLASLTLAARLQLVHETGGGWFRFHHALTVEAILADLLGPQSM